MLYDYNQITICSNSSRACDQNIPWFDLDLQSDRTSTHTFEGNQLRLWFTAIAYILLNNLGEKCLVNTELKNATIGTIRTKLLKLGAVIPICKQRVLIAISSACPYKEGQAMIYERLSRLPCPG